MLNLSHSFSTPFNIELLKIGDRCQTNESGPRNFNTQSPNFKQSNLPLSNQNQYEPEPQQPFTNKSISSSSESKANQILIMKYQSQSDILHQKRSHSPSIVITKSPAENQQKTPIRSGLQSQNLSVQQDISDLQDIMVQNSKLHVNKKTLPAAAAATQATTTCLTERREIKTPRENQSTPNASKGFFRSPIQTFNLLKSKYKQNYKYSDIAKSFFSKSLKQFVTEQSPAKSSVEKKQKTRHSVSDFNLTLRRAKTSVKDVSPIRMLPLTRQFTGFSNVSTSSFAQTSSPSKQQQRSQKNKINFNKRVVFQKPSQRQEENTDENSFLNANSPLSRSQSSQMYTLPQASQQQLDKVCNEIRLLKKLKIPKSIYQQKNTVLRQRKIKKFVNSTIEKGLFKVKRSCQNRQMQGKKLISQIKKIRQNLNSQISKEKHLINVRTEYEGLKKRIVNAILIQGMNTDVAEIANKISQDANGESLGDDAYHFLSGQGKDQQSFKHIFIPKLSFYEQNQDQTLHTESKNIQASNKKQKEKAKKLQKPQKQSSSNFVNRLYPQTNSAKLSLNSSPAKFTIRKATDISFKKVSNTGPCSNNNSTLKINDTSQLQATQQKLVTPSAQKQKLLAQNQKFKIIQNKYKGDKSLKNQCHTNFHFNQWNDLYWTFKYQPTEPRPPRTEGYIPRAPQPYLPLAKKNYGQVQNLWQRRYKTFLDEQKLKSQEQKRSKQWNDDVELFYKQYKTDAKSRFTKESKYQNSYTGLSSVAINRYFGAILKQDKRKLNTSNDSYQQKLQITTTPNSPTTSRIYSPTKRRKQSIIYSRPVSALISGHRPKSAIYRSNSTASSSYLNNSINKLSKDPIQLTRGLPFKQVFDIVNKSQYINAYVDKKQCQQFADTLSKQLKQEIESIIAERVINEYEQKKISMQEKRKSYLKSKIKQNQREQREYQKSIEKQLVQKKRKEEFMKWVKSVYINMTAEMRGSSPISVQQPFQAAKIPTTQPYSTVSRRKNQEFQQKNVVVDDSQKIATQSISLKNISVQQQQQLVTSKNECSTKIFTFNNNNSSRKLNDLHSTIVRKNKKKHSCHIESEDRQKFVRVPRCKSCSEDMREISIKHYSGGPIAQQKVVSTSAWEKQIAILKIQRFFRHLIAKRRLIKKRRQMKQEEKMLSKQKEVDRKRLSISQKVSRRNINAQQNTENSLFTKASSRKNSRSTYNIGSSKTPRQSGKSLNSYRSKQNDKSECLSKTSQLSSLKQNEVLNVFQDKIKQLKINLSRRIDPNFLSIKNKTHKREQDRIARIRQRDILNYARKNTMEYMYKMQKILKPRDFTGQDQHGNNSLIFASMHLNSEMVKFIIKKSRNQIDINHRNQNGDTALHFAMKTQRDDQVSLQISNYSMYMFIKYNLDPPYLTNSRS